MRVTLNDIERIDVDKQFQLASSRVQYQPMFVQPGRDNFEAGFEPGKLASSGPHSTVDLLFASLMKSALLDRLAELPERAYSSARLLICDRDSYDAILKLQRIYTRHNKSTRLFLYGPPYNITAVFLLEDVVDVLDRSKKPLILMKHSQMLNRKIGQYNYGLIKETFPFLKMTDLIIFLADTSSLESDANQTLQASARWQQFLNFLGHFARSNYTLELQPIVKQVGYLHPIHANVSILLPLSDPKNINRTDHFKPSLPLLSSLAHRLSQLMGKLRLNLQTITYRAADPNGFTKIFTQIVASNAQLSDTSNHHNQQVAGQAKAMARVIVIDRFFDLQSLLYHSELYGPFVDQEMRPEEGSSSADPQSQGATERLTLDLVDELDDRLQLEKLTDALNTILKYTVNLKNTGAKIAPANYQERADEMAPSVPTTTTQAIRRHMDIVRVIYKHLNEGYLLILRLESSLLETMNQLRSLNEPLAGSQQDQVADRLIRIMTAFKQLTRGSGKSIGPLDLVRLACILVDVVNVFVYIHSRQPGQPAGQAAPLTGACKILYDMKSTSLFGKHFRSTLKSKNTHLADDKAAGGLDPMSAKDNDAPQGDEEPPYLSLQSVDTLMSILEVFDAASMAFCGQRATMTLESIIERFMDNQLDRDSYPTISLGPRSPSAKSSSSRSPLTASREPHSTNTKALVVVVFLGSLTYDELSRIKALEARLKGAQNNRNNNNQGSPTDILLLACALRRPDDILRSL